MKQLKQSEVRVMNNELKTVKEGTVTTKGFIKHLKRNGIAMPVKVRPCKTCTGNPRPPSVDMNGFIVFALPGGGSYISEYTIETKNEVA